MENRFYKGLDGIDRNFKEQCEQEGNMKKYWIEWFTALRDEHCDDLPEQDVRKLHWHPADPLYNKFKCQGNYIAGLKGDFVFGVIEDGLITDFSLRRRLRCFGNYQFNCSKGLFTSSEEIDLINILLTDVLNHLSEK